MSSQRHPARVEGTCELPLPPLPFVVVYRFVKDIVEIANVVHGAQKDKSRFLATLGMTILLSGEVQVAARCK